MEPSPPKIIATLAGFLAEPLDQLSGKLWVVLLDQMIDGFLLDRKFLEMTGKSLPVFLSFLAFGQIQLRDQLLHPLQRDRLAVVVIVTNDVLLILGVFGHA